MLPQGTWQFLAIRLVEPDATGEPLIQNRIDDVESFYHLALWLALKYTPHELDSGALTDTLRDNFAVMNRHPETGHARIGNARSSDMKSGDLASKANFANMGIRIVLQRARDTLSQRYIRPERVYEGDDSEQKKKRETAEADKAKGLKALEDTMWLPNLLNKILEDTTINWDANGARVRHVLQKFPRYLQRIPKRKTETSLHSEGSRKVPRKSGKSTPQDNRSVPEWPERSSFCLASHILHDDFHEHSIL